MTTRTVFLELTQEQEETIKALFAHNEWDYKELDQLRLINDNNEVVTKTLFDMDSTGMKHLYYRQITDHIILTTALANPMHSECYIWQC